jgi:hypothetical protein
MQSLSAFLRGIPIARSVAGAVSQISRSTPWTRVLPMHQ